MKYLDFYLLLFVTFITSTLFAQTPRQIELDLLSSFKKIEYWRAHAYDTTINPFVKYDSLKNANRDFAKKIKLYAEKYPATITHPFRSLKKEYYLNMSISTSSDNMFRIYSWDTWTGGDGHFFENLMEYKSGLGYKVIIDSTKELGDNRPKCRKLYNFIANNKIYYLLEYLRINSERNWDEGARIYSIENGQLVEANLIKSDTGLHSELSYKVNSYSYGRPKLRFNNTDNIIYLPLVDGSCHFRHKFIVYKFTGQYFERVKI
jgi:hypothetical protein